MFPCSQPMRRIVWVTSETPHPLAGSFTETLAGWAEAVVTGRARLGGIPVGIVATEGRLREKNCPADPADVSSHERIVQQVGRRTTAVVAVLWAFFAAVGGDGGTVLRRAYSVCVMPRKG